MPKHAPKADTSYSSAIGESPDVPGRTTGDLPAQNHDHDLADFEKAIEAAVAAGIPHSVLRRRLEVHEWDNAPEVR